MSTTTVLRDRMFDALIGFQSTWVANIGLTTGLFQAIGIPAVICGPGNIEQAHKPDEFVSKAQLDLCEAFLLRLAKDN